MNCPVCSQGVVNKEGQSFCPVCNIFLGDISQTESMPLHQLKREDTGAVYQKRAKKGLFFKVTAVFFIILIILAGLGVFMLNFTPYGYREKIFYRYGFTKEASSELRKDRIEVANLFESKPLGLQHSGMWKPNTNSVQLKTANDEVAIHEFAHAWWEDIRKDESIRRQFINDMITLSKMDGPEYTQTIHMAQSIVTKHCNCSGTSSINHDRANDHEMYAYVAGFLMGKFREGPHKLPEFMWKYYEGLFSENLRVTPCYETKSCDFPQNNDAVVH